MPGRLWDNPARIVSKHEHLNANQDRPAIADWIGPRQAWATTPAGDDIRSSRREKAIGEKEKPRVSARSPVPYPCMRTGSRAPDTRLMVRKFCRFEHGWGPQHGSRHTSADCRLFPISEMNRGGAWCYLDQSATLKTQRSANGAPTLRTVLELNTCTK